MHIENAKRVRNGQHAVTFVKVLSGQAKRFHGTKFKLVLQARSVAGIQTFDVDVWHRVQRTALGDITSNKFALSKFEDSDASFITRFEKSGEDSGFHGRLSMFGDSMGGGYGGGQGAAPAGGGGGTGGGMGGAPASTPPMHGGDGIDDDIPF